MKNFPPRYTTRDQLPTEKIEEIFIWTIFICGFIRNYPIFPYLSKINRARYYVWTFDAHYRLAKILKFSKISTAFYLLFTNNQKDRTKKAEKKLKTTLSFYIYFYGYLYCLKKKKKMLWEQITWNKCIRHQN